MRTPALLLLLAFVSIIPPSSGHGEWGILTEQNFSSQIRLHPHILLFVTAPWCGESRSLKNEITQLVQSDSEYDSLKLMVVYRNSEKVLAQAIGAANEITILYYHHAVPYHYRGKLRASNILSSLHPYLTSPPQELPLRHLKSPESLKAFLESSDKTLILFEFCGWTSTLLSELKRNVTEDNLWHGNFSKTVETDRVLKLRGKNNQKVAVADHAKWKLMCRLQSGFGRVPWLEDFSYVNDTAALQENDRANGGSGQTCNHEQFKQFSSFLSKLIAAAKEFSLPPERQKFGLITEKSLASPFTVGASDSWAAVLQLAGCPHCSKILKAGDDIQRLLKMENPIVSELEDNRQDHESSLPANKPSVILFVDRSSGSFETRRTSMKALCTFREVAAQHKASDIINWGNDIESENSVSQADEESGSVSLQKTARSFKTIKLENKVSFVIMDGDKHVALDTIASGMEGSSLQELLTNLVHRRKEKKLSSIAKDVGFRLLSDDVHIKILDALPSQAEVRPGKDTSSAEGSSESSLEPREGDVQNKVGMSSKEKDKMKPPESESSSQDDKEQVSTNRSEQLVMAETDKAGVYKTKNVEEEIKHYVLQDELAFSYSSLVDFLHGYLNGSLSPYTRSETTIHKPKEATVPPFVNLDFHEADSIPRITVNTFSHMVQAWNQSSGEKTPCPLCKDVLVLFSNSWCGFCQRMELAVREVYRSLKDCKAILLRESKNKHKSAETPTNGENLKSPLIYLMDCTLNDCSLILNSINQREVYPSVVFFPAERNKVILYEGETSVTDITEFLARHANNSREFFRIIPTLSGKGRKNSNKLDQSSSAVNNEVKEKDVDKLVEVVVSNRDPPEREVTQDQVSPQSPPMHSVIPAVPKVKIGTILVATERLGESPPFANSKILILKAGRESGFMGVIFNKRLRWSSFPDLDGGQTAELLKDTILSLGGPVMDPEKPLLALSREGDPSTDLELSPGVYFLDHESVARRIQELKSRDVKPSGYWFFVGYSSWSYEQLFDEIGLGVWDVDNSQLDFAWP
ncbi:BnaC05g32990D [Brassica napus]|uniref:BnaC05g32990D protein n=1 Tax=Brassica napus TaxID=3708 RepID=A0A078GDL9_BRANA|nr:BnaC05g32990D [Brassica napus]